MKKVMWILVVVLAVFAVTGCGNQDAGGEQNQQEASEEKVEKQKKIIQAYGAVEATESKTISVDFDARVDKIHVKQGERIKKGDKLVDFDISALKNDINSKKMELEQVIFDLEQKNNDTDQSILDLKNAKDELKSLEDDKNSKTKLYELGAVSKDAYDQIKKQAQNQRRQVEKLALAVKEAQKGEKGTKMKLRHRKNALNDELKRLQDKYEKAHFVNGNQIVSTMDNGVVSELGAKEGAYVNREVSVMTIVNLDTRVVKADIAEESISNIYVGQKAEITSIAVPGKTYTGTVLRIWGTSIKKGGETIVPVEISVDNIDEQLYMNFNVDVSIDIEKEKSE